MHGVHKADNASMSEWSFAGHRIHVFKPQRHNKVPICVINPSFEDVFRRLFGKVVEHLRSKGWLNHIVVAG